MNKMEVYGTIYKKVHIEPLDVIDRLYVKEVGYNFHDTKLGKDDDGYYIEVQEYKYIKNKTYIDEETYNYINALEVIYKRLKNKAGK